MKTGNENIFYIQRSQIPKGRKVTYANAVCDYRPLKDDPYQVRLTVGGDRLPYPADAGAPAATILEAKLLFNSVISTPQAKFMTADIKDYFLCTPMERFEYIKIPYSMIPEEIRLQYNLANVVESDGYVYCEVKKGMYGLKQAARLAFDNLVKLLAPHGYCPIRASPGLWKHETRPTLFTLCVDDFGIKYTNKEDATHLLQALGQNYKYSVDWEGNNYLGLALNWNYQNKWVEISMPTYIAKALHKFQHETPSRPQDSPHDHTEPVYGQKVQFAKLDDSSPLLNDHGTKRVQEVSGTLLYYARTVDPQCYVHSMKSLRHNQPQPKQQHRNVTKSLIMPPHIR
jgi:hypothetical protein